MVGGLPGKVKGRYPPGTLHRPCSVGDFNEVEDEGWNIDQMSDQEVASEFEKMLENMNLSEVISIVNLTHSFNMMFLMGKNFIYNLKIHHSCFIQEKKTPLRILSITQKREMLKMNEKNIKKTQLRSPTDYIQYLSSPDLNLKTKYACIESLRVALTNNSLEWIQEFGARGLKQVLSLLNECFRK